MTIFVGFLVHVAKLVLGADPELPRVDACPWKTYSLIGLASLILVLAFWLPGPLFQLIREAARVAGGQ